jgi:hypothetical protein
MLEYVRGANGSGMVRAICPGCDRLIFQRVNPKRLANFVALLDVSEAKA